MQGCSSTGQRFFVLCTAVLLFALPLRAYTDPGSGVLLWQLFLAGVAGFMFYVRRFLQRLRPRLPGKETDPEEQAEQSQNR